MVSCVTAILEDLHQSRPDLLTVDLLEAATMAARAARASVGPEEVSEAAQGLENATEEIRRGKQLDPDSGV